MYKYYLIMRPPGPGCNPSKGLVDVDSTMMMIEGRMVWGSVTYDRKLTAQEIDDYELMEAKENAD